MKRFNKLTAWLLTLAMLMTFIPSFTLTANAAEEELMCHDSLTRNDLNRLSFITSEDEELWLLPSDKMIGLDTEILDESFGYALNVTFVNDSIKDWGYYNQATGMLRAMAYEWLDFNVYENAGLARYASKNGFTAIPDNGDGEIACSIDQSYAIYRVIYYYVCTPYEDSVEAGIVGLYADACMELVGTFTPTYGSWYHSYAWNFNETYHWQECFCGYSLGRNEHGYDNGSDPTCNTCGYERALYAVTVNDGEGGGSYAEGVEVSVSAVVPEGNYRFVNWSSEDGVTFTDANAAQTTFVMPAHDVTVNANFRNANEYAVTLIRHEHSALAANTETALENDQITLTVVPDEEGYVLVSLTVDGENVTDQVVGGTYTFSMPAKDVTVEATFKAAPYTITCEEVANGAISVNKGSYAAKGDTVKVNVVPEDGYELSVLEVTDENGGAIYATNNTFIMPAGDVSVEAVFRKKTYTITTQTAQNGSFTVNRKTAEAGETVLVKAVPDNGYMATKVSITAGGRTIGYARNGENDFSFTMPASDVTVIVDISVPSNWISLADGTKLFSGDSVYDGDVLTINPTNSGPYKWMIPTQTSILSIKGATYTVKASDFVSGNRDVSAVINDITFLANLHYSEGQRPQNEKQYTVNIDPDIEHGMITADKWSTAAGQSVTLTVTPDYGYKLSTLSVKEGSTTINVNNNAFTMPAGDVTVFATFTHACNGYIALVTGQAPDCIENGWKDYYQCLGCDKTYINANGTTEITNLHAWKNGDGKITAGHTGGTATCIAQAECRRCGASYGEINPNNHARDDVDYKKLSNDTHGVYYACCKALKTEEAHTYFYTETDSGITESCELCEYSASINLVLPEASVYNGNAFEASYTGSFANPDATVSIQYMRHNEDSETEYDVLESAPVDAGTYIVRLSVGEVYADSIMTIAPKEITLKGVEVEYKDYDGTPFVEIDPTYGYGGFEADGVSQYDSIKISCETAELESANAGQYKTVTVKGLKVNGEDAHNYTVVSDAILPVYNIWGNSESSVTVYERFVDINLFDQEAGSPDAIDPSKWEIGEYNGLLEGHRIESLNLVAEMNEGSTKYGSISVEEGSLRIVDADGNDVTANYSVTAYAATLTLTCPDHDEFEDGFCKNCDGFDKPVLKDNGTEEDYDDYYEIANAGQLFWFAEYVNNVKNDIKAVLTDDITIPEGKEWIPIGNSYPYYSGSFDGQNHTISGLYVNQPEKDYVGLFGYVGYSPEIKNLTITNSTFIGNRYVGALAGYGEVTASNIAIGANVTVHGNSYTGGMIGYNSGTLCNCYAYSDSLVGYMYPGSGSIENCYFLSDTEDSFDGTTAMTAEQFASGEVAYRLQSGIVGEPLWDEENDDYFYDDEGNYIYGEAPHVWGQTIGTDDYPVFGGAKVLFANDVYYNEINEFEILSNGTSGTKATAAVAIPTAGTYTLIFADYEGTVLNKVDTVTFTVTENEVGIITVPSEIEIALGTGDKIMLWQDMTTLVPLCEAYIVK